MTPKLPACTPRHMVRALLHLGFIPDRQVGSHRTFYRAADGRRVTVPMHARDLNTPLLHRIIKQAGLTADEFHHLLHGNRRGYERGGDEFDHRPTRHPEANRGIS